ncbi:3-deoxy-D-manno-octulosonic acid kinase [Luteimonas pelagia]
MVLARLGGMVAFDAAESLTPFRDGRGFGAILHDVAHIGQARPEWFSPAWWGERARPVDSGGRGGAWFVDAPMGAMVLRHYLRGGWAAHVSRDAYLWRGVDRVRSVAEFRLGRELHGDGLPVARPVAAWYQRQGATYRAAILVERIDGVRSLADRVATAGRDAPWEETGRLVARFHRAGLDHADLNAHNVLFDPSGRGWLIDLDRGRRRIPATGWRERNLARLRRSLLKLRGPRAAADVLADFRRLRNAYDGNWARGY